VLRCSAYSSLRVGPPATLQVTSGLDDACFPLSLTPSSREAHCMLTRSFVQHDQRRLTELTIETFRPFYEESFRPLVGDVIFANQHGTGATTTGSRSPSAMTPGSTGMSRSPRPAASWPG